MVKFCPKCNSLMIPKNEDGKVFFVCTNVSCGFSEKPKKDDLNIKEKIESESFDVEIADSNKEALPVVKAVCRKCKNTEAYFWTVQTRSADEAETKFYRCTKCKHTWREYD